MELLKSRSCLGVTGQEDDNLTLLTGVLAWARIHPYPAGTKGAKYSNWGRISVWCKLCESLSHEKLNLFVAKTQCGGKSVPIFNCECCSTHLRWRSANRFAEVEELANSLGT
jgi:hypothetical protein